MHDGSSVANLALVVSRFDTAMPKGPAFGTAQQIRWGGLTEMLRTRREGQKDGDNIVLARFNPEPDGRVRRLKQRVAARTCIGLDVESNKKTGEVPPSIDEVISRLAQRGWAAALYTSHNHTEAAPRYRVLLPLSAEISPTLPAVEVVSSMLGLDGVLDTSKVGAASVFYLPSAAPGMLAGHCSKSITGEPVDAEWMQAKANAILVAREAEQAAQRADALQESEKRRSARVKAAAEKGQDPSENLIEAIRQRLDLEGELLRHGYKKMGDRYLCPGSETGIPGVHILRGGDGVERAFSHHSGDPLAAGNLPSWCRAKAIDAVDVVTILDFGGDQKKTLHEMAARFGIGEPLKSKAHLEEPVGFNDVPPPDGGAGDGKADRDNNAPPSDRAHSDRQNSDLTEDGVALAFSAEIKNKWLFDHTGQSWYYWNGARWKKDIRSAALDIAREFVRGVRETTEKSKTLGKIGFVSAVVKAAAADPRIAVSQEIWDQDPMLLGVPGGTVDLRTGNFLASDPRHYIARQTAVAPAPAGATSPLWQSFLRDLTGGNADTQQFLQRLVGYIITGDVTEEILSFLYGVGGNGKGVLIGALTAIMNEYAVTVPIEVFTAGTRLNLEYYRAQMAGSRLVVASETEAGATWAESQIKEMTGNEAPLSARHPHGRPFTFRPQFKIALVGNYAPRLKGRSASMERRLRIVPCTHRPTNPDLELKDKLRDEYPAILRWMLDGCLMWQQHRLGSAAAVTAATGAYFEQQDAFKRWIEERCIMDQSLSLPPGKLHADFAAWAKAGGEEALSSAEFAEMVDRTHGLSRKKSNGVRLVVGLGLKGSDTDSRDR